MSRPIKDRMEVRCHCGNWGRLIATPKMKEGKQVCKFVCGCDNPEVNFENPWSGN